MTKLAVVERRDLGRPILDGAAPGSRLRDQLARVPLFADLDGSTLEDLAARMTVKRVQREGWVITQEDAGEALFVVLSGRVKVVRFGDSGREVILAILRPGEFFGEMALLDGGPRSADVVALEDTTLGALGRDAFLRHIESRPRTAVRIMKELSGRLRRANETIAGLALEDVGVRLARKLIGMARDGGETDGEGLVIRERPTQQDLAHMVGTCRETVSRTLSSLVRKGLIRSRGRSLVITHRFMEEAGLAA
jgi:CRP-like cAMP-binding protein